MEARTPLNDLKLTFAHLHPPLSPGSSAALVSSRLAIVSSFAVVSIGSVSASSVVASVFGLLPSVSSLFSVLGGAVVWDGTGGGGFRELFPCGAC